MLQPRLDQEAFDEASEPRCVEEKSPEDRLVAQPDRPQRLHLAREATASWTLAG
jgi:hypothetical protein